MKIVTKTAELPGALQKAVVALGNFDGVHRGHQAVLAATRRIARDMEAPFGVVTFEPHPRSLFFPDHPPFRLTPPAIKRHLLADMGVDVLYEIPFTAEFSQLGAHGFVHDLLLGQLGIVHAVAGHDFVFGHKRGGDAAFLKNELQKHSVAMTEISPQTDPAQQLWSSTRVREHLEKGEMRAAAIILGRAWAVEAAVQKGDARGNTIGFPTANLALDGYIRPRLGVYAVRVAVDGALYKGVANLGKRPTVGGLDERLEAHLFDFSGNLYGKVIRVDFVDFIRDERRFPSLEALKEQISNDCLAAQDILK